MLKGSEDMLFTEKLDLFMAEKGISRMQLAEMAGVPYTTLAGIYSKGYQNIKLQTLRKLSDVIGVSIDVLADDSRGLYEPLAETAAFPEEKYSSLPKKARTLVDSMIEGLWDLSSDTEEMAEEISPRLIRQYVTPAAAGYASPAEGEDYILVPRGSDVPANADFSVRIAGDSMEPFIGDGSCVYVSRSAEVTDGDVGIFFVDGDMKCKQYCEDNFGNIYLFSLNRARSDADMTILASGGLTVCCFGKVLLKKRPPLPES